MKLFAEIQYLGKCKHGICYKNNPQMYEKYKQKEELTKKSPESNVTFSRFFIFIHEVLRRDCLISHDNHFFTVNTNLSHIIFSPNHDCSDSDLDRKLIRWFNILNIFLKLLLRHLYLSHSLDILMIYIILNTIFYKNHFPTFKMIVINLYNSKNS